MRVLIAGVDGVLGQRLAEALRGAHDVSVMDDDPRDRASAARATADVDAVVCGVPTVDLGDPLPALDRASRGVYNLITTPSSATRFVLLSSLRPFERYPLDHMVTEYWAPRPTTDPEDLVPFTAEGVVREAAHTLPLKTICLRLGNVVEDATVRDPRAVHIDDAVQAIDKALKFEQPQNGWWAFHIVGAGNTRFPLGMAGGAERASPLPMPHPRLHATA